MTDDDPADVAVLGALLERHPAMAGLDELAAELHDLDERGGRTPLWRWPGQSAW